MDITPRKRRLEINDQLMTPKVRKVTRKSLSSESSMGDSYSMTPTGTSNSFEGSEDYFFLPPQRSPRTVKSASQSSSPADTPSKINRVTSCFESLVSIHSFYKQSTPRDDKARKILAAAKRYTLSHPSVPGKRAAACKSVSTDSQKAKKTTIANKKAFANNVNQKQASHSVEKKKGRATNVLKILRMPVNNSQPEAKQTMGPTITNRKFFKSGGLADRIKVTFGRHTVPVAAITKEDSKESLKTTTVQQDSITVSVNAEPVVSPVTTASPQRVKPQWPIKYKPSTVSQKSKTRKAKQISTSSLTAGRRTRTNQSGNQKQQMMIDAGQLDIGPKLCNECGMLYATNDEQDVALHSKMHDLVNTSLKFNGWKQERVVKEYDDGRVILILPDDPYFAQKKVTDVKVVVDRDLGFSQKTHPSKDKLKVYLFVSSKKIVGSLFVEPIEKASRVVRNDNSDAGQLLCCGTETEPASCGVNRIWTLASERRRGVASRLLDCMLQSFYYGCILSADNVAFSDPTPDGRCLATNFCKSPRFLVYKY